MDEKPPEVRRRREHLIHKSAFECWYRNDRNARKTALELGNTTERTLYAWAKEFSWRARADERDLDLERAAQKDAVDRQRKLLEKQRKVGEMLRLRGTEFFTNNKLTNPSVALKAVSKGIELERQAEGLPTWLLEIQNLTDDELLSEKQRLLRLALLEAEGGGDGDAEAAGDEAEAADEE